MLSLFVLFLSALSAFFVHAAPTSHLESRAALDVFVPPVTFPTAGVVWEANSQQNVTWDVSNPPVNITNARGRIMLVRNQRNTGLILANDFDILLGTLEITVPWMVDGDSYQLVLFGDSGNFSPNFTIHSGIIG